jgi:hypothetical protein
VAVAVAAVTGARAVARRTVGAEAAEAIRRRPLPLRSADPLVLRLTRTRQALQALARVFAGTMVEPAPGRAVAGGATKN